MTPITPEPRDGFRQVVFAKDQPEYLPLPANIDKNNHEVETKWKLSWRERFIALFRGSLYLTVLTFGKPLQPIKLTVNAE